MCCMIDGMTDKRVETDIKIGQNIRQLRGGRSQDEIAEHMREHGYRWVQSTVWNVEKGERPVRAAELKILADYFGVPPESLWEDPEANQVTEQLRQQRQSLLDIEKKIADAIYESVFASMEARQVAQETRINQPEDLKAVGPLLEEVESLAQAGVDGLIASAREQAKQRLTDEGAGEYI